jgi:hypothetical protein
MDASQSPSTLLAENASRSFVVRLEQLALLESLVGPACETRVVYVRGDAGIGKSALASALLERMRAAGAATVKLDCRTIEPTERGRLDVLAAATSDEKAVARSLRGSRRRRHAGTARWTTSRVFRLMGLSGQSLDPRHRPLAPVGVKRPAGCLRTGARHDHRGAGVQPNPSGSR